MLTQDIVTAIYCIIDELMKQRGHRDYPTCKMTDSEVIITALVSALYFGGHQDNARGYPLSSSNIPHLPQQDDTGGAVEGRQCSMRRYFYGVKVQVLTTADGLPVECCFVPGSEQDVNAQGKLLLEVAAGQPQSKQQNAGCALPGLSQKTDAQRHRNHVQLHQSFVPAQHTCRYL